MPNRLAAETSPYLLQHKDNPVEWYPWGEEAFERARREDLPVLLSVGYSACHWCHVMERESFEDAGTAAYMNENFVNVKVDREERPDVDALYMEAVQEISGHGGWPMTVFLDPDGVPFYAGTYFPPDESRGMPSFQMVMEAVLDAFHKRREELRSRAPVVRERLGASGALEPSAEPPEAALLSEAVARLLQAEDRLNGGFGGAPKFPPASALELLMARGEAAPAERALDAMAAGGIHDQLAGGFARYTVDAIWLVPHFEKMLYDNALLASAYLHGWQLLGHERYRAVCEATLDWMLAEMRGPEGGFYSALDADSEGVEGKFYVWSAAEAREALEAAGLGESANAVLAHFGISEGGNFEGANVLHLPGGAAGLDWRVGGDTHAQLANETLGAARAALLAARERRVRPGLDDKRLAAWNALALAALAEAGAVLGREDYLAAARNCAEFLLDEMRDEQGNLLRTFNRGEARLNAYLEDHAFLVEALLTLYEATFEVRWFGAARQLAETMLARFEDPERGGFFSTSSDHEQLIARRKEVGDHPIPSGNSAAAMGLSRLAALTGERRYAAAAEGVFKITGESALRHPQAFAHLLRALDFHLAPTREVALLGDDLTELAAVVRAQLRPHLVLAGGPAGSDAPELLRDRPLLDARPTAYVCENFSCQLPVNSAAALAALL